MESILTKLNILGNLGNMTDLEIKLSDIFIRKIRNSKGWIDDGFHLKKRQDFFVGWSFILIKLD